MSQNKFSLKPILDKIFKSSKKVQEKVFNSTLLYGGGAYSVTLVGGEPTFKEIKMEENKEAQVTPVKGYRQLTGAELDAINFFKAKEESLLRELDRLLEDEDEKDLSHVKVDKRWVAIGRTHLEQAFMAINRAIAKPQRVVLHGDKE